MKLREKLFGKPPIPKERFNLGKSGTSQAIEGDHTVLLKASNLTVGYRTSGNKKIAVLEDLDISLYRGQFNTLIGPNGCGKSTLIKSLIGMLPPLKGNIQMSGKELSGLDISEMSQFLGVVLTEPIYEQNLTVKELVSIGRYQHTNWYGKMTAKDISAINKAVQNVGLTHKATSKLCELSDGEKQRALIAKVLAQDVDLIILDEPTAHLDLPNRMEVLMLLKKLSHEQGKGVLLSTHELGLALQVSDKVLLINKEGKMHQKLPERLILNGVLDATFGNIHIEFQPESASFEIRPTKETCIKLNGKGHLFQCVKRMVKRHGYIIVEQTTQNCINVHVENKTGEIKIEAEEQLGAPIGLEQLNLLFEELHTQQNGF